MKNLFVTLAYILVTQFWPKSCVLRNTALEYLSSPRPKGKLPSQRWALGVLELRWCMLNFSYPLITVWLKSSYFLAVLL